MILGMPAETVLLIAFIAFLCEYTDSTLGMGYGTTMTPLLLLFGFSPIQIVPAVLLSELVTGITAGVLHHREGNVTFSTNIRNTQTRFRPGGIIDWLRTAFSRDLRIVIALVSCSIFGGIVSVLMASIMPKIWVELYIGILVVSMGIFILACFNRQFKYSPFKIAALGFLASFNKGLTGGGYGPLIVSGQVLSGVESKNAVGITSLAEGLTCVIGVGMYLAMSGINPVQWKLAPVIISGAILSVPFSAKSVKHMNPKTLKIIIAILTIILGLITTVKTVGKFYKI